MNLNDKKIILDDDTEYIIIENVELESKNYAYLVNANNPIDAIYVEIVNENGFKIKNIDNNLFKEKIFPLFVQKFKNY